MKIFQKNAKNTLRNCLFHVLQNFTLLKKFNDYRRVTVVTVVTVKTIDHFSIFANPTLFYGHIYMKNTKAVYRYSRFFPLHQLRARNHYLFCVTGLFLEGVTGLKNPLRSYLGGIIEDFGAIYGGGYYG